MCVWYVYRFFPGFLIIIDVVPLIEEFTKNIACLTIYWIWLWYLTDNKITRFYVNIAQLLINLLCVKILGSVFNHWYSSSYSRNNLVTIICDISKMLRDYVYDIHLRYVGVRALVTHYRKVHVHTFYLNISKIAV